MKKEVKLLRAKAISSLVLAVEFFNRPSDRGRTDSVLILLDHAYEMLLKSAILHRGGRIRETREPNTVGIDKCIRKGLTDAQIKFLDEESALTIQAINGLRDAAQHHILEMSEEHLYLHTQAGLTLFRRIHREVFGGDILEEIPARVLPVSTIAPGEIIALFDREIEEVKKLLAPKKRQKLQAEARLRGLAILDGAVRGETLQPSEAKLDKLCKEISKGSTLDALFPGVSSLQIRVAGGGPSISLNISKKEGIPIQIKKEDESGSGVVAIKRVNELDYYSLGLNALAKKVGLTAPKALAVIRHLGIQKSDETFKEIRIGKQAYKRYSQKALESIKSALPELDLQAVWMTNHP